MNRNEFAKLLNDTIIPECLEQSEVADRMRPIGVALKSMLPQKLYRYRSCSTLNLDAFDKDLIYAVTADKFNDPYDTLVYYNKDNIIAQIRKFSSVDFFQIFKQSLEKVNFEFPQNIIQFFGKENLENLRKKVISCRDINPLDLYAFGSLVEHEVIKKLSEIRNELKMVSTMACLSENVNSVTMWSHYAQNHEGFALEYDLKILLGDKHMNCCAFPVIYDNDRMNVGNFIFWCVAKKLGFDVKSPDLLSNIKLAIHKSKLWEYEKEWRIIHTEKQPIGHSRVTSIKIIPKAIYYGERISDINRKILHYIAQEKGISEYDMYIDYRSLKYEMLYKPSVV